MTSYTCNSLNEEVEGSLEVPTQFLTLPKDFSFSKPKLNSPRSTRFVQDIKPKPLDMLKNHAKPDKMRFGVCTTPKLHL